MNIFLGIHASENSEYKTQHETGAVKCSAQYIKVLRSSHSRAENWELCLWTVLQLVIIISIVTLVTSELQLWVLLILRYALGLSLMRLDGVLMSQQITTSTSVLIEPLFEPSFPDLMARQPRQSLGWWSRGRIRGPHVEGRVPHVNVWNFEWESNLLGCIPVSQARNNSKY
jgi:hypothetical protein